MTECSANNGRHLPPLGLVEVQADGVVLIDQEGQILYSNPAAKKLLGDPGKLTSDLFLNPEATEPVTELEIENDQGEKILVEATCAAMEWEGKPAIVVSLRPQFNRGNDHSELRERIKELKVLHAVTDLIHLSGFNPETDFAEIAAILADGMQHPDAAVRLCWHTFSAQTPGYQPDADGIEELFSTPERGEGSIEVIYLGKHPPADRGPFLKEEIEMISSVAKHLQSRLARWEMALQTSQQEALMRMACEAGKLGAWRVKLPEMAHSWSDAARDIHDAEPGRQYTVDELINFYPPGDREHVRALFTDCVEKGVPFDAELRMTSARGKVLWVRIIGEAVRNARGEITEVHGTIQDVTDWKETAEDLARSHRRFQQLARALPFIVWSADPDGTVDYSNQAFNDYTGVPEDAPPATRWQGCVEPGDLERCMAVWNHCVKTGDPYEVEMRLRRHDGEYRWFKVQANPVYDAAGTLIKWYGSGLDIHETKRLQAEASNLARQLSITLESINDGFLSLNHQFQVLYMNRRARQILEVTGHALDDLTLEKLFGRESKQFAECFQQAVDWRKTQEFTTGHGDGQTQLEVRVHPSEDGVVVCLRDITEVLRDREMLRLLAKSMERLNDLVVITLAAPLDEPGPPIVYVNEAFERLTGYQREEVVGKSPRFLQGPDTDRAARQRIRNAIQAGKSVEEEILNYSKEGTAYWLEINIQPIHDDAGNLTHFAAVERDITEEKRSMEALRASEEKHRLLGVALNSASDPVVITDRDGVIQWANAAFTETTGYSEEEAMGKTPGQLLKSGLYGQAFYQEMWETILAGKVWSEEMTNRHRDGTLHPEHVTITPVKSFQGEITHFIAIKRDLTDEKKRDELLLRSQRVESIGTLAGGIAHDLNNLLAPILMGVEILRNEDPTTRQSSLLEEMDASVRRAAELIRQLLVFARGDEGTKIEVKMERLLKDLDLIIRNTFPKNIEWKWECAPDLPNILCDPTQIGQVLVNLAVNARDAMIEGGGTLDITTKEIYIDDAFSDLHPGVDQGRFLLIEVSDTGCGMTPEVREKIFDPFFTTKKLGEGTGLGLATSTGIVENHKGFINVYSEPGRGSVFKVYLPALKEGDRVETEPPKPALPPTSLRGRGELILVVDDEESIRRISEQVLKLYGYKVRTASEGTEALKIYEEQGSNVRAVISDMMMPGMDGPQLVAELRLRDPDLPIILVSGLGSHHRSEVMAEEWAGFFLHKPYSGEALLAMVAKVLGPTPPSD